MLLNATDFRNSNSSKCFKWNRKVVLNEICSPSLQLFGIWILNRHTVSSIACLCASKLFLCTGHMLDFLAGTDPPQYSITQATPPSALQLRWCWSSVTAQTSSAHCLFTGLHPWNSLSSLNYPVFKLIQLMIFRLRKIIFISYITLTFWKDSELIPVN